MNVFKSVIEKSNSIQQQLMKVGELVDLFEKKDCNAIDTWLSWLKESEILLKNYNYNETSIIAGLRANIIAEQHSADTLRNKRKRIETTAISTIDIAQNVLFTINSNLAGKIEQVRILIRQILIPAKEAGFIQPGNITDFNQYIESLFQQFTEHEQLKASFNNAVALIGKIDVMRIIAEELDFS